MILIYENLLYLYQKILPMKNYLFAIMTLLSVYGFAPQTSVAQSFGLGDFAINAGIGVGNSRGGIDGGIGIHASAEYGFVGISDFGLIGGGLGMNFKNYDIAFGTGDINIISVGPRGTFHYVGHSIEALDLYAGLGIDIAFYSGDFAPSGTDVEFLFLVGSRYMFSDNFGAFAELNVNGVNLLNLGISIKF